MRNIYVNPLQLLATAYHAGQVSIEEINAALSEERGLNMPCGYAYDEHRRGHGIFFWTDKETKKPGDLKKGGMCMLNVQPHDKPKKNQAAATPGQVLPQTAGAPQLSPELIAQVAAAVAAQAGQVPQELDASADVRAEADFGDVMPEEL